MKDILSLKAGIASKNACSILLVLFIGIGGTHAQNTGDTLSLTNKLQPISEKSFFKSGDYFNWCPSIIKGDDGLYHLFYSRWPEKYSFTAWLPLSEIAHATAPTPTGPWTYKETVLKGRGKGHWDEIQAHNPKIKYFNGKYYLYYIATNYGGRDFTEADLIDVAKTGYKHKDWMLLRNNQRTGVAVATSLNGPWHRLDSPIIEPSGPITRLTVNPAITQGKDGRYYLIVKGDKPGEQKFIRNQALAIAPTPTGPFVMQPDAIIDYLDTEDMSMWYDKKRDYYYAVFHTSVKNFIGMVSSADGINWYKANNFELVPNKELKMVDGSIFKADRMERPFIYVENDEPKVLAVAVKDRNDSYLVFVNIQ